VLESFNEEFYSEHKFFAELRYLYEGGYVMCKHRTLLLTNVIPPILTLGGVISPECKTFSKSAHSITHVENFFFTFLGLP